MCGIVGYVGNRRVVPVLLDGLRSLEYRGYDSAGVVYPKDGTLLKHRAQGKLHNLEALVADCDDHGCRVGLGHTRWATHGAPSEANAHPHTDCSGKLAVVHNGIIENYHVLREELTAQGHVFCSQTDTEVLAHLIETYLQDDLVAAVRQALARVQGSYAVGVLWAEQPDILVAARNQSPLVLGVDAAGSVIMASDIPAILPHTNQVIFLEDQELAVLASGSCSVMHLDTGEAVSKSIHTIQWTAAMAEKSGYKHFMLKEIFEQPQAILNTIRGRLDTRTWEVSLPEISLTDEELRGISRIFLVACGTSWHAALVAKYWIEKWVGIPVEVDIASEFRYRRLLIDDHVLVIPISQSGETADTLAGLRLSKTLGAKVISICNVLGSTITRESDGTIYTNAGPEIGVASTKAFTSQLTAFLLLTLYLARIRNTAGPEERHAMAQALYSLPELLGTELPRFHDEMLLLAGRFSKVQHFIYLGRGSSFPIALEGALKLKEISYIHAEGYAAGEMKHGPIALIDQEMPVLALAPSDSVFEKVISNVEEVKARNGRLILLAGKNSSNAARVADYLIAVPEVHADLNPIIYTLPLQFLAYHIACLRGCDVDQPRNLAKSVTVE